MYAATFFSNKHKQCVRWLIEYVYYRVFWNSVRRDFCIRKTFLKEKTCVFI